jgi:magnesium/cobalt transport protein CorA
MNTLTFTSTHTNQSGEQAPYEFHWTDIIRTEPITLAELPSLLSECLHERHLSDLNNNIHPPHYEITDEYELLIMRSVDHRFDIIAPKTRSIAFILKDNTIITLHDQDDDTLSKHQHKWLIKKNKQPEDLLSLFHILMDHIAASYLELQEPLNNQIQQWQPRLLDPNDSFNDWQILMHAKSRLRWLKVNLELQRDILESWREETTLQFTSSQQISFNDLDSHFARIERLSDAMCSDLDSLTNIYFATVSQKTNTIMQFLAAISAIFLPLNLIAGIFGMNFENLPFIKTTWGVFTILTVMLLLFILLYWLFKNRRWF